MRTKNGIRITPAFNNLCCVIEDHPVAGPLMFSPSLTPYPPSHTHPPLKTRLLELADRDTTVDFVFFGGGREKRRLLYFLQSEPSPYLWCWYNDGTFCQRQTSGSTEPFVALAETRLELLHC
jgi:hypothetical protein